MRRMMIATAVAGLLPAVALAKGDLASKTTALEPLLLGNATSDYFMSQKEYRIETGKSYRLKVKSAGKKEYNLVAPELWRNSWIRQIAVNDIEIKTATLDELDFDDEGEAEVFFVPIRPGTYEFRLRGLEEKGMVGKVIVE